MELEEKLKLMKSVAFKELGVVFDSNGSVLNKKQLKSHINRVVLGKLNFAISFYEEKNINTSELKQLKEIATQTPDCGLI